MDWSTTTVDPELPPIPSTCDKDVVGEFIDQLDLVKYINSLTAVRKLRDYLLNAFKDLVNQERATLERLDQERRTQKAVQIRETAAMMDRFIDEISRLLGENDHEETMERNVNGESQNLSMDWDAHVAQLEITPPQFVVPRPSGIGARPRPRRVGETEILPAPQMLQNFVDHYSNTRRLYDVNQGAILEDSIEIVNDERPEIDQVVPSSTYGSSRFRHWLSEDYVARHEIRKLNFGLPNNMFQRLPWPDAPKPVWPGCNLSENPICTFVVVRRTIIKRTDTTGDHRGDNSSILQVSSVVNLARHQRSQNQETPRLGFGSRYDGTPGSASGAPETAAVRASSTPLGQNSDPGLSFIPNLTYDDGTIQLLVPGRAESTPLGPSLPGEHPLGLEMESGTLALPGDDDETAVVGLAGPSIVRSRLGGTPSSTPFLSFRPRLPVIDEEHQRRLTLVSRELQMSVSLQADEPVMTAVPEESQTAVQPVTPPLTPRREWSSVFRARDHIVNYAEGPAPRDPLRFRRPSRPRVRAPRPALVSTPPPTPEQLIQREEVLQSDRHIATTFMSNLLQNASTVIEASQLVVGLSQVDVLASIPIASPALRQIQPTTEAINSTEVSQASTSFSYSGACMESTAFLPDRAGGPLGISANTQDQQAPFDSNATASLPPISSTLIVKDKNVQKKGTSYINEIRPEIMDCSNGMNVSVPPIPMEVDEAPMEVSNTLANMSAHAYVTDVQILPTLQIHSLNVASQSECRKEVDFGMNSTDGVQTTREGRRTLHPLHRVSVDDLAYISRHADMLRLMVDRQKELTMHGKSQLLLSKNSQGTSKYYTMPAVKVYDPKVLLNMDKNKIRVVHGLFGALVRQPQVDIQNTSFITNRKDATMVYSVLLELKTAHIINLSPDGRFFPFGKKIEKDFINTF
ncbi:sister chromatid cohesion protein solo [Drosophila eugracilis]|uniref:sister chromatid cohesion protein solo n=1 Tax=Drosophila eugracilis TaxID=29029 RepID=UPI001BDB1069|nr:sister chromatid cohesion protein solo [Drosophila eugracilis]